MHSVYIVLVSDSFWIVFSLKSHFFAAWIPDSALLLNLLCAALYHTMGKIIVHSVIELQGKGSLHSSVGSCCSISDSQFGFGGCFGKCLSSCAMYVRVNGICCWTNFIFSHTPCYIPVVISSNLLFKFGQQQ